MHRVNVVAVAAVVTLGLLAGFAIPASAQSVTAFEGARLIVGDGRVIENATLVVEGTRIAQVGQTADVRVPAGATRVDLAGKTVMPMMIDTHVHLSPTRDALIRDLRLRAYYGVSAALSLGTDSYELLEMRGQTIPGAARFLSAGRGITMPEPGRTTVPYWITTEAEGRKAVEELAAHKVDIVKIWVDTRDGKYQKLTPEHLWRHHRRGAQARAAGHRAHLRARRREGAHACRDRRVRARRSRQGHRRRTGGHVQAASEPDPHAEPAGSGREGGPQLAAGGPCRPRSSTKLEAANTDRPEAQASYGIQARNLAKLNAAGVRITLGTDGNRPWGPHEEMLDMVLAGMTPMQVIVAATRNSAEFLRIADAGTLQAGKSADFIVLDANPLDDITNTRRISAVILRGAAVDRTQPVR